MSGEPDGEPSAIDLAADRFERAWKAGQAPLIEDYLAGLTGERRRRLFEGLLIVERELRSRNGDLPDAEGYRCRFPDLVDVIDRNFGGPAGAVETEFYAGGVPTTLGEAHPRAEADGTLPASLAHDPRFRVLRHHADGGVGRVSVALDLELHRQVALKELKDQFADDPQFRQRFLLEVEVTGRLEHPGVIPVYSLGRDERGRPFYAMRFIEGEDLEEAITSFHAADLRPARDRGQRALALRQLLRRFVDVCNVVAYAHSRGVLHRDLKPRNILLGPYGETLVVDWGMAKRVDGLATTPEATGDAGGPGGEESWKETQQGMILGTIPYMSPEQAEGGTLGTPSDVYGLGATLYHIVTGRPPIAKGDRYTMLTRARSGEFSPARQVNQRVPAALEAICQKAMSRAPGDRYASPRALADEIEHWLADEPISAWKEPWTVRARRWVARHRTPVAAAAAALAVALVATGYLLFDYQVRIAEQRGFRADGLVAALRTAEVAEVGRIANQLRPLRSLVLERLRSMANPHSPESGTARRNAALALRLVDPSNAEYLAELIGNASPLEFLEIRDALGDPGKAVPVLLAELNQQAPTTEFSTRRRGRIAAALIVLGCADRAWPLLARGRSVDPGVRTELIHNLAAYGVDPRDLAARLAVETDAGARRALVLALGEYPPAIVPNEVRRILAAQLLTLYARDADPGLHSAIDWLLRRKWDLGGELDSIDQSWRGRAVPAGQNWFVNSEGVTMAVVVVAEPVEFEMGSPDDEYGHESDERIHHVRLDRSFAIASREVTVAQFGRFLASDPKARRSDAGTASAPSSCTDCPILGVEWPSAAAYCNWLSRSETLEPYYVIRGTELLVPHPDGLGYRLPSEREWEYACRADSRACRPCGASDGLLDRYAWFLLNGAKSPHPVGQLKPNDLGLFDMLGNAFEWTEDRYTRDGIGASAASARDGAKNAASEVEVVVRGGAFNSPATALRSAYRDRSAPLQPLETYGFRYVRALRLPREHEIGVTPFTP